MLFTQLDGANAIIYNVIGNINDNDILVNLDKTPCPHMSVIGGEETCFIDKSTQINSHPRCDTSKCVLKIYPIKNNNKT